MPAQNLYAHIYSNADKTYGPRDKKASFAKEAIDLEFPVAGSGLHLEGKTVDPFSKAQRVQRSDSSYAKKTSTKVSLALGFYTHNAIYDYMQTSKSRYPVARNWIANLFGFPGPSAHWAQRWILGSLFALPIFAVQVALALPHLVLSGLRMAFVVAPVSLYAWSKKQYMQSRRAIADAWNGKSTEKDNASQVRSGPTVTELDDNENEIKPEQKDSKGMVIAKNILGLLLWPVPYLALAFTFIARAIIDPLSAVKDLWRLGDSVYYSYEMKEEHQEQITHPGLRFAFKALAVLSGILTLGIYAAAAVSIVYFWPLMTAAAPSFMAGGVALIESGASAAMAFGATAFTWVGANIAASLAFMGLNLGLAANVLGFAVLAGATTAVAVPVLSATADAIDDKLNAQSAKRYTAGKSNVIELVSASNSNTLRRTSSTSDLFEKGLGMTGAGVELSSSALESEEVMSVTSAPQRKVRSRAGSFGSEAMFAYNQSVSSNTQASSSSPSAATVDKKQTGTGYKKV